MTTAGPLGLRLFLEGIEVPVISASVNISPSSPATAAIQIVPTDAILNLLPRTLVHLFYLTDAMSEEDIRQNRDKASNQPTSTKRALNRMNVSDDSYKLLFCGEVIGINFSKNSAGRSVVLQCLDLSSYWDTCYQWFADYSVHGNGFFDQAHIFCQAGSGLFDNITGGASWMISKILNSPPKNGLYKDCKGLLGGLISLLEVIGGVRADKNNYGAIRGVNDFFTIAELRYNLTGMIGAVAGDTTSAKIYSGKAFFSWLESGMTSLGSMVSFRDILRQVGQWVFHDIYPNPSAMYVGPGEYKVKRDASLLLRGSETRNLVESARKNLYSALSVVMTLVGKGQNLSKTTTVVEGQGPGITATTSESTGQGPSLTLGASSFKVMMLQDIDHSCKAALDEVQTAESGSKDNDVLSVLRDVQGMLKNFVIPLVEAAIKVSSGTNIIFDSYRVKDYLAGLIMSLDELLVTSSKYRKSETGGHLFNQLVLPETFFMAPPRCNVLFPDQYTDFQYSRNFMREVTRLSCGSGLGWIAGAGANCKVLSSYYYAPNTKTAEGDSLATTIRKGAKILLPHEVHSGIIPKIEWLSEGHKWGARKAKTDNKEKKIYYIQKLANFQFFMNRWQSRGMAVRGRFNPNVVLGFPALVINHGMPTPQVASEMAKELGRFPAPVQFLGKVVAITHSINQSGGTTDINLAYCRTHDAKDDEFLGTLEGGRTTELTYDHETVEVVIEPRLLATDHTYPKGKSRDTYVKLYLAVSKVLSIQKVYTPRTATRDELLNLGVPSSEINDLTPVVRSNGEQNLTDLLDGVMFNEELYYVPDTYVSRTDKTASLEGTRVLGVGTIISVVFSSTSVKVSAVDVEDDHILPSNLFTGDGSFMLPEKITIKYRVSKPSGTETVGEKYNPEDIIKPDWYDSVWDRKSIGKEVYERLLGCGSIIDDNVSSDQLYKMYSDSLDEGVKVTFGGGEGEMTLEQAINTLTLHYSMLMNVGFDAARFVRAYTDRPIATLPEIMGSADYDPAHGTGSEGFHSRSFGDYNTDVEFVEGKEPRAGKGALDGLISGEHPTKNRLGDTVKDNIPDHLDPRGRARQRVAAYMAELNLSRGLKG